MASLGYSQSESYPPFHFSVLPVPSLDEGLPLPPLLLCLPASPSMSCFFLRLSGS
jgi:hypothetical protein